MSLRQAVTAFAFVLVALAAAGYAWINLAPSRVERWHVDPTGAEASGKPNEAFVAPPGSEREGAITSPVWDMTPPELMAELAQVAQAESRVTRLAGEGAGPVTWIQRSRIVGFPDYISARAVEVDGGAALAIWSRARYGYGDMGVNRARLERWLEALPEPRR